MLRDEGIAVEFVDGAEAAAARLLVQPFRKHARTGLPLVTLKSAISLDGFTATPSGDSKWISGPESRALVHSWRAEADAVAVGIGTALADDPLLTARDTAEAPPSPADAGSSSTPPPGCRQTRPWFGSIDEAPLLVFAAAGAEAERVAALRAAGAEVIELAGDHERRLARCARRARTPRSRARCWSRAAPSSPVRCSPRGRSTACGCSSPRSCSAAARRSPTGPGFERVAEALKPLSAEWQRSGEDMLAERAAAGVVSDVHRDRRGDRSVSGVEASDAGARIGIVAGFAAELREGDSVCVEGVCLTAAAVGSDGFEADVMNQTLGADHARRARRRRAGQPRARAARRTAARRPPRPGSRRRGRRCSSR